MFYVEFLASKFIENTSYIYVITLNLALSIILGKRRWKTVFRKVLLGMELISTSISWYCSYI